jgi:ribosomal protein L4
MRRQALFQAVALKLSDPGAVVAVGGMEKLGKTKEAQTFLAKVAGGKSCLLVLAEKNATAKRFWQNLTKVRLVFFRNLNAWLIKQNQVVIFDREIFNRKETKK